MLTATLRKLLHAIGALACFAALEGAVRAQQPIVKFVSVPDFINMDMQRDDPRLFDLTAARQAELVAEINAGGAQVTINPHVGNFIGTVENGYRGASQVLLEALAAEQADFFTVSGDINYSRWPKNAQLTSPTAPQHIRTQADIYYNGWIDNVAQYGGFDLSRVYTVLGDHEIGDNDWPASKRPLIPTYKQVYVEKMGNESTVVDGAYVDAPAGFEGRTYAVKRGNVLLIGVDQFETFNSAGQFTQTAGEIASVKLDVTGTQLAWLDSTLTLADGDSSIDHVIVMAHAPIAANEFVKTQATSSGLDNATDENGPWWQTMSSHRVDLFLPGEVHAISMQLAEDVLQVVSGTNIFQPTNHAGVTNIGYNLNAPVVSEENYLVVEAYEDRIDLTLKAIETRIWGNSGLANDPVNDEPYKNREARVSAAAAAAGFQTVGTLTIDKSSGSPVYRNRSGLFISEWTFGAPINIDLNGDNLVNDDDALQYLAGFHADLSGLTLDQAFAMGDVNGDRKNDYADFRIFKDAFDGNNGLGAFEAAFAVPEPTNLGMVFASGMIIVGMSRLNKSAHACERH
jgi:hypothetical protein